MAKIKTGGGETGTSFQVDPTAKGKAGLPNSNMNNGETNFKPAGTKVGHDEIEDTDTANNTKTTKDSGTNKASIMAKGKPTDTVKESDLDAIFVNTEFSEEFKQKVFTLFESIVNSKIEEISQELEDQANEVFEKELETAVESIKENLDEYLEFLSHEFVENNMMSVEQSVQNEMSESFMNGLKELFENHYIDIPEDKINVLEALDEKVKSLESDLTEAINTNIEFSKILEDYRRKEIIDDLSEGLTELQKSKLRNLSENISYEDEDDLIKKINILKESNFVDSKKPSSVTKDLNVLNEDDKNNVTIDDPIIKAYSDRLTSFAKR